MNLSLFHAHQLSSFFRVNLKIILIFCNSFCSIYLAAQGNNKMNSETISNNSLLDQYIKTKGNEAIIFDESNIKQFWVDNSVVATYDSIKIALTEKKSHAFESVLLKIQFNNVNETQDCRIDVISETDDCSFSIFNTSFKLLSTSQKSDNFINYSIISSCAHLEETCDSSFFLKFYSNNSKSVLIKKIIFTFSNNKDSQFLATPGKVLLTGKNILEKTEDINQTSFSIKGKQSKLISSNKILVTNNTLSTSVTVKNIGDNPTQIYIGYATYTKNHVELRGNNYPYTPSTPILNVISATKGSERIIVDTDSDWNKDCFLAINAKDDQSDIPNTTLLKERILQIKKIDEGKHEITLNRPLDSDLPQATKMRVHGMNGAYLYTNMKILQPGEEETFNSTIQKDESILAYTPKSFSKGVYYVVPIFLSYSTDSDKENTVLISDYTVSY